MDDLNVALTATGASPVRVSVGWMLLAFLVTFVVTRLITHMIRTGRGPFGNASVSGVHVHHQVYGIFLMLVSATAEFAYEPGTPAVQVLAAAFGCGAALTLDEFALWLYLSDVYWAREGRKSVDAVFVAATLGGLLVLGADPFRAEAGEGRIAIAATITVNLLFGAVAIMKGKTSLALIGVLVPVLAFLGAVRLAKPGSAWARRRYKTGSRRLARSLRRYPPGRVTRLDRLKNVLAGAPPQDRVVPPG